MTLILKPWYNNTNPLGHTLTWKKERQLHSFDSNEYTYNANGIRTSKTVGGVVHNYLLDGAKILRETWNVDNTAHTLETLWDNEDAICGIKYNGASYYFLKNLQGDIIAITDNNGAVVTRYSYDAWGVPTIVSDTTTIDIATINPFRYRGYYYDAEIQMYYLQSRYYNPVVGRFVNVDEATYIGLTNMICSYNLYTYCNNNPVMGTDVSGYIGIVLSMAIGAVFGLFVQYVLDIICNLINKKDKWWKPSFSIWDYTSAGLSGALAATGIGKMAAVMWGAILSAFNYVANSISNREKVNVLEMILSIVIGAVGGLIGGAGANLKNVSGIVKVSKNALKTAISPKKIAMYLNKIANAVIDTIINAIRYILSAIAGVLGGETKKIVMGWI